MSRGLMYWVIVLIWVLSVIAPHVGFGGQFSGTVSDIILLVLFILLGWQTYGPPVHG